MKPQGIFSILDLTLRAREMGQVFNPLFTGEAGLGKSQVVQQWVKKQRERNPNFGFLDLRIAYMEAPDLIGLPETEKNERGIIVTRHRLPEFWPTDPDSEGLILLEEPNRGTTGVMNCLMQLLTDRKIHNYELPRRWIIAGCINPESSDYDVNTMDVALKDRFEEFEIEYDHASFVEFMINNNWHPNVVEFIKSGVWLYKTPDKIGQQGKYISPRTWSKVNSAELSGLGSDKSLHYTVVCSILGKDYGREYHAFCYDVTPVTAQEILKDKEKALERLKAMSDPSAYRGDLIAATVASIEAHYGGLKSECGPDQIDEDTMIEVAKIIPADHALNMIKTCGLKQSKGRINSYFKELTQRRPDLIMILKDNIKLNRDIADSKSNS